MNDLTNLFKELLLNIESLSMDNEDGKVKSINVKFTNGRSISYSKDNKVQDALEYKGDK